MASVLTAGLAGEGLILLTALVVKLELLFELVAGADMKEEKSSLFD